MEARYLLKEGTWLDPEELAYNTPTGAVSRSNRRAGALCPDGKLRTFRVGIPDTMFSCPAVGRISGKRVVGFVYLKDGVLLFGPDKEYQNVFPEQRSADA